MRDKDLRKALIREATDDLLKQRFTSELGSKAIVERSSLTPEQREDMDKLRQVLGAMGEDLLSLGIAPKGLTYRGSLSVHVFTSEILRQAAFQTLTNLGSMDFTLADGALRELTGTTLETFGAQRRKLRSGF